jgi:TorA maturation chaperone TorD
MASTEESQAQTPIEDSTTQSFSERHDVSAMSESEVPSDAEGISRSASSSDSAMPPSPAASSDSTIPADAIRQGMATLGRVLAPFFVLDPVLDDEASQMFELMARLDVAAAASEWPFAEADAVRPSLQAMHDAAATTDAHDLARQYRHLFVGPEALACPPWGSVYTDHDQVVFGESTLALRSWLRTHGIAAFVQPGEPEDHIGTMLQLAGWIAEKRPELLEEFCAQHFFTWSSHYLEQLEQAAEGTFYEGLAHVTRTSLEGAQRAMGLTVAYPHFYR